MVHQVNSTNPHTHVFRTSDKLELCLQEVAGVGSAICGAGCLYLRRACSPFRTLLVSGWDKRLPIPVGMVTLRGRTGLGLGLA